MSAVVLSIPGDGYEWSRLQQNGDTCQQTAAIFNGDKLVCAVTVRWPQPLPTAPVVCHTDGRTAAERD